MAVDEFLMSESQNPENAYQTGTFVAEKNAKLEGSYSSGEMNFDEEEKKDSEVLSSPLRSTPQSKMKHSYS